MTRNWIKATAAAGLVAGGLYVPAATAADLGGDCCADLEERVAELEATTVRKGNRKVSLKLSGWVSAQVMYWDDGHENNTYVNDNHNTLASNFQLAGSAKIDQDLSAGFNIHIELINGRPSSLSANQLDDGSTGDSIPVVFQHYWYLKSNTFGQISVGRQSQPSDNAAIVPGDVSGTNLIQANWVLFDGPAFFLRPTGGPNSTAGLAAAVWGQLAFCQHTQLIIGADCNGVATESVVYRSPTIAGFKVEAGWGEDDFWDVAASWAGDVGDFKVAGKAAFSQNNDNKSGIASIVGNINSDYFQIGVGVKHVPTGLFVYGAYGIENNHATTLAGPVTGRTSLEEGDHFYVKAGIQQKWFKLGPTTIYGEYSEYRDQDNFNNQSVCAGLGNVAGTNLNAACANPVEITGSKFTRIGFGIQQDISAASMFLWAKYRHNEVEADFISAAGRVGQGFEDMDMFLAGGLIFF